MSLLETYRRYLQASLPSGGFWQGLAAERLVDALARASEPLINFLANVYKQAWPFDAARPVLEQWYEFFAVPDCVAIPADTEDLRTVIVDAFPTGQLSSPAALFRKLNSILPLVEFTDLPEHADLEHEIPMVVDDAPHVIEAWYSPLIDSAEVILCIADPDFYTPATNVIRPVAPIASFRQPTGGPRADETALHWHRMDAVSTLTIKRFLILGNVLLETATTPVDPTDAQTMDELFPLLNPADGIGNQRLEAAFSRTWAGQTSQVIATVIYFP